MLQRDIVLSHIHRKDSDALFANKHQRGHCPKCASSAHVVGDDGTWTCADCGKKIKAQRGAISQQVKETIGREAADAFYPCYKSAA